MMADWTCRYAEVPPTKIQERLVRNPAYNENHVELHNWCRLPLRKPRKPGLQETLEADIAAHGMRNPILIWALPEGHFLGFGGSRLRAAQVLDLPYIPCIIMDYTGEYEHGDYVYPENITDFFTDIPCHIEWDENQVDFHNGLERMRREEWLESSTGFDWLKGKGYDTSFVDEELPWSADILAKANITKTDES